MRFPDGPHLNPFSRYSHWHVLLYSLPISQCTRLHAPGRAATAKHCNVKSSILVLSKERIHEFQKDGVFREEK